MSSVAENVAVANAKDLGAERRDERVASHQVSSKREGVERVEVGRVLPASQRTRKEGLNT